MGQGTGSRERSGVFMEGEDVPEEPFLEAVASPVLDQ